MKIVWDSNAPWPCNAYAQQTGLWAPLIQSLGHEVTISAFYGLAGAPLVWNGITVLPGATTGDVYGSQLLAEHVKHVGADLVITLSDIWVFSPRALKDVPVPVAHWMPVDCSPLSGMDRECLEISGAVPIAMSRFGETMLRDAGFSPLYVPHGLPEPFCGSLPDREQMRAELGIGDRFAIGMNAANKDAYRKGMGEQFAAFAALHEKHPDTVLMVHGLVSEAGAINLWALAEDLGISNAVHFMDQYAYVTGQVPVEHLVNWYTALDLYSGCSLGEGFGIPILEAQSCNVPVVVTDASAMPGLCGGGWLVSGERMWNPTHNAWWVKPSISRIARAYEKAYQRGPVYQAKRAKAREFALAYEPGRVLHEYWKPALEALEAQL